MDVTIRERKWSFRSEYDISADASNYFARKAFLRDRIQIQAEDGRVLAKIQGRFSPLRMKYDFELADGTTYRFWCEKLWKSVFRCEGNHVCFHMYEHKGLRYSIFEGDSQIAAFTKNRITIGKGHKYDIQMNADANLLVIISMILALNTAEDDSGSHTTVEVDLGNIGPQERAFDESWRPL